MTSQIPQKDLDKIAKYKQDALGTKHVHQLELASLDWWNNIVDSLGIAVPILYFPARYLAKGTQWATLAEHSWEVVAAILLAVTVIKVRYGWQERTQAHSRLRSENISLATQADALLSYPDRLTPEQVNLFFVIANTLENSDRDALKRIPTQIQQYCYREGLKEIDPGSSSTVCPICEASPWEYASGSCQTCGNTPKKSNTTKP